MELRSIAASGGTALGLPSFPPPPRCRLLLNLRSLLSAAVLLPPPAEEAYPFARQSLSEDHDEAEEAEVYEEEASEEASEASQSFGAAAATERPWLRLRCLLRVCGAALVLLGSALAERSRAAKPCWGGRPLLVTAVLLMLLVLFTPTAADAV